MRIAICDDENEWVKNIEEYVSKIKEVYRDIEYDTFCSGEELLHYYNQFENVYDVLILDIEMKGISGIDVAQKIREKNSSIIIFFLTSHKKYVYDCFRPLPMNFWVKPVSYNQFKDDIKRAYNRIENSEQYIKVIENRNKIRIKCNDIIFIENKDRKSWINTICGIHKVNKLLSDFEKELDNKAFVRVYKSFIINLRYVHVVKDTELELYNSDTVIPISRTYKANLIDHYINFKEKEYF